jgi:alanine-synthesizing transaminase
MKKDFYTISKLPSYVFAEVNEIKAKARAEGKDIIDFGMGNPMSRPPQKVIDKLTESAAKDNTHGYSMSKGIKGLRKAQAGYYKKRFNVDVDPESEVVTTIGSKEGLFSLCLAIAGPDDDIVVPDPCYPIHMWGVVIAGSNVVALENSSAEGYFSEFRKYVENCKKKPLAIIVNYPSNPTAEVVGIDYYERLVEFCKLHEIYIISDLAYAEIYYGQERTPSILEVEGAKDIAVEFTSLSKTYSMAGWRIGFAVGSKDLVGAMIKMKSYLDYGIFTPIQIAATVAINDSDEYIPEIREMYKQRRDSLVSGLENAGWTVTSPEASMFIWTKLPEKLQHLTSLEFSKLLLEKADVAVAPGVGFGDKGEGFVRMALVENKNRIRQAVRNIKKFLAEV